MWFSYKNKGTHSSQCAIFNALIRTGFEKPEINWSFVIWIANYTVIWQEIQLQL